MLDGGFMNKIDRLIQKKNELELTRKKLERLADEIDLKHESNMRDIAKAYKDFYDEKINKEFILYDRYPSVEALEIYLQKNSRRFPLYDYGVLNVKELAEVIKHIYQFKTGQEFEILTIGANEKYGTPVYGGQIFSLRPHVYFMVGNNESLSSFKNYNGMYVNSDKFYTDIYLDARGKNMVNIELDRDYRSSLGIECLTGSLLDEKGNINYSDGQRTFYDTFDGSINKQIFSKNILSNLNSSHFKGIKDVLDFEVHPDDSFIANILISIIIYKRNNQIQQLTEADYSHIFDVLFHEKVDIVGDALKDIPRKLTYVPKFNSKG